MNQATSPAAQTDQPRLRKRDASTRWRKLLEDQRASGLPVSAFCRERGIAASSLFAWRRRLAGGEQAFKPVKIAPEPAHGGDAAIELYLPGARRLVVRRGFDRQLLVDVIHALEAAAGPVRPGAPA